MSSRVRTALGTARRLPLSRLAGPSTVHLAARRVWLNATSFPFTSSHTASRFPHHSSPALLRHFSTASPSAPAPTPASDSDSALQAVHSMSELRDVVDAATASKQLVVLEWKAVWCGKCKVIAKELQRLQAKHPSIAVRTVDIEEGDLVEGKREAGIEHIPVLHFIQGGELVHEIVGVRINEMAKTVEKYAGEQSAASA